MIKKTAPAPRQLISLKEAGARLGLHPRTVRRMITDRKLVGYVVGRQAIRVDSADVDALGVPVTS